MHHPTTWPTANRAAHTDATSFAAAAAAEADDAPDCAGGESFALMVLGHSMAPEFLEGEIIIIEPDGLAKDGSFVLAWHQNEWTFRQLIRSATGWSLHPLNPAFQDQALDSLDAVRGVIIQKALPGRRCASKHYI
ncbi:S24 family peptidase [Rhodoferax sp.]|uniref:S24 family peptidase n=1 Tax=Rhodoferax sp. TaxID=50421 RepID=UPI00284AFF0F|nr:S24 family peptidase [Rhodoferax sp.]MDR3370519.1 S24 family peptidase [Rhodoferax sp.]